ncbi:MAG: response regulator [Polyangiaceae bacterium]
MTSRILVVDDSPSIRKVVSSILGARGYSVRTVDDGDVGLKALAEEAFSLILLDFAMPTMNGLQFCRAMRAVERWRSIPVVLMTGRADRVREHFVELSGALDVITKPFDEEALVTVVEHVLERAARGSGSFFTAERLSDAPPNSAPTSRPPGMADEEVTRGRDAKLFVTRLASTIAPALTKLTGKGIDEGKIAQVLLEEVSPFALQSLGVTLRDADFAGGRDVVLSGDLAVVPIGAVLQLLQMEQQTGAVVVTHASSEITITLRGGLIDLVQSRGAGDEFRLGRYFVQEKIVSLEEIDAALADSESPLGLTLVRSGKVDEARLRGALLRQSSELIYEVLRWQRGRFELRNRPPPPLADNARLALPVASVVIEGFRRVDEWRVIEAKVGRFDEVLVLDPVAIDSMGRSNLGAPEQVILDAVDGVRTIRQIVPLTHMSSFDACKILFQLMEARLVRRRAR